MLDAQDLQESLLNAVPEAAVLLRRGRAAAVSDRARRLLRLKEGDALPPELLCCAGEGEGTVTLGGAAYRVRLTEHEEGQLLVLIPAPQTAVTDGQLDGALRQLRACLAQLQLSAEGLPPGQLGMFWKSYHQIFRLMDNLDTLRRLSQCGAAGLHTGPLDLAGLCRHVTRECAWLLEREGVELVCQSQLDTLLIPGDGELLERLLLELVANGARWTGRGVLTLSLRRLGTRGIVTVTPGRGLPARRLEELLERESSHGIPRPGTGAGLGLPLAERIARLHGGSLLIHMGEAGAPTAVLALPTGPMPARVTVRTPGPQRGGGLSAPMVALADLLSAGSFCPEEEDLSL